MARLLAISIWLISIAAIVFTARSGWWLPEAVAQHRDLIDGQFRFTMIVIGAGFFLAQAALGVAVWRYRAKDDRRVTPSQGNTRVEIILTAITAFIFITLAITGQRVWAQLELNRFPPDALQIEVTAQQFIWNFRYPGSDGKF